MSPQASDSRQDTQGRIVDAAIRCVKRWGVDKVTLNDIAKEAGVTRPTVYSYFANRDAILQFALLQSAQSFAARLLKQVEKQDGAAERLLVAMEFALRHLPSEPYLALLSHAGLATLMNQHALSTEEGRTLLRGLFRTILDDQVSADSEVDEMAEMTARLLLSLLTLQGPTQRSAADMRALLQRRLLPMLGL